MPSFWCVNTFFLEKSSPYSLPFPLNRHFNSPLHAPAPVVVTWTGTDACHTFSKKKKAFIFHLHQWQGNGMDISRMQRSATRLTCGAKNQRRVPYVITQNYKLLPNVFSQVPTVFLSWKTEISCVWLKRLHMDFSFKAKVVGLSGRCRWTVT